MCVRNRVSDQEFEEGGLPRTVGPRVQGPGFRVQGSGFRGQGSGFRVQGSGCRVQGSGCGVSDQEFEEGGLPRAVGPDERDARGHAQLLRHPLQMDTASSGRSDHVCKGARFPDEGERCVVSS